MTATPTLEAARPDEAADVTTAVVEIFAANLDLPVEEVAPDDNFFHLDGDSLSAIEMLYQVKERLGVDVGIGSFFRAPTPAGIAEAVRQAAPRGPRPGELARPDRPPLSHAQEGVWFQAMLEGGRTSSFNIPVVLEGAAAFDAVALQAALQDVSDRHEALRTVFPDAAGVPFQDVLPAGHPVRLSMPEGVALDDLFAHGFDIAHEPPLACFLPAPHRLVLVVHHIGCDGASVGVLLQDLDRAYSARLAGRAPRWERTPLAYADVSVWERDRLGETSAPDTLAARQAAFWAHELGGAPALSGPARDRSRPASRDHACAEISTRVPVDVARRVVATAHARGLTPFTLLQVAAATAIDAMGAGEETVFGVPVSTRTDDLLTDTVGLFVTMLPLRTPAARDRGLVEVAVEVQARTADALAHADLPFSHLVAALNPERASGVHPVFQMGLTMHPRSGGSWSLPALGARASYGDLGRAKYDATLGLTLPEPDGSRGIDLQLEYATELIAREEADSLLVALVACLSSLPDVGERR